MALTVTLPVPTSLTASYVVPLRAAPADPAALVRAAVDARLGGSMLTLATGVLDGPLLRLDVHDPSERPPLPFALLRAYGATEAQSKALATAARLLTVRTVFRPGWPPVHEWVGRAVAAALAAEQSVPVLDLFVPRVLEADAALGSLPDAGGAARLVDWVVVPYREAEGVTRVTTRGLARFGLPEVQAPEVPAALVTPWSAAMAGLAHRLLAQWVAAVRGPEPVPSVELPALVTVTEADVAAAYRGTPVGGGSAAVRLRRDETTGERRTVVLTVRPPGPRPQPAPDHVADVCRALFGGVART